LDFGRVDEEDGDAVKTGSLNCLACGEEYEIANYIPRFVPRKNYASSFGLQWTVHARTQHDSYSGVKISETRFFQETKWPRNLEGEFILEVGSGSGRFTTHAAATGATVVSLDYSYAVEANHAINGRKENVLVVQGDVYRMPVKENFFDKLFCFGVLQHTPDVKKAFFTLPSYLKPGGRLAVDVYSKLNPPYLLQTKYWVRPLTRRIPPARLYKICEKYVNFMWPIIQKIISKIPRIGGLLTWQLLVADYRGKYDLNEDLLKEWAILDTFDMLSPAYDSPQTIDTVSQWFKEANFAEIEVHYGYNGIEGRGTKNA
jgi:ubiquinone/menaquinone biosynthesis C-methylase UbiE